MPNPPLAPARHAFKAPKLITKWIPVAAATCICCATWAQESVPGTLGNVTVSGARESSSTRLPLTAKETPQSVSTVEREQIEQQSLTSIDTVLRATTGIHVSFYDTQRPLYYARGFQITDFQVDGLPTYSNSTNQEYDTSLYERVDIVRGANGILTGVGTPSATINLIRKRPTRTFGGSVTLTAGSWNYYRSEIDMNVPLNADGSVRSRFVVAPQKRESFRDRYKEDKYALMGVVEADLGSSTVASVGYQRQNNEPIAGIWGTIPFFTTTGARANLPISTNFSPSWTRWSRESGTLFATLDHQLNDNWALKASINHTEGNTFSLRTYGYGTTVNNAPFVNPVTGSGVRLYAGVGSSTEKQDTIDAYLSGKFNLFGRQHDLTLGVNTLRTTTKTDAYTSVAGYSYTIPNVYTWDGTAPVPVYNRTGAFTQQITKQDSFYGSARWRLSEALSLLTGARVTNWRRHTDNYNTNGAYTTTTARQQFNSQVSPLVGVVYDINKQLSAYASYTGIFNPQNYKDKSNAPLDPVKGISREIGLKGEWPDQGMSGSFAVFEVRQDNYGIRDSSQPAGSLPDGSSAYVGVNGTRSTGWEADVVKALAPGWQGTAGITRVRTTRNAADLTYANLPEWQAKIGTQYRFQGSLAPLELGAQLLWQGRMDAINVPSPSGPTTVTQSPFGLLNLNASWRFSPATSLNAAVFNALDKRYLATLDYANYGDPRFLTLTLRHKF